MAVPKITPEERAKALQKAQQVRKDRAALREKMKAGAMTMKDVIDKKTTILLAACASNMFWNLCPESAK